MPLGASGTDFEGPGISISEDLGVSPEHLVTKRLGGNREAYTILNFDVGFQFLIFEVENKIEVEF